MAKKSWLVPLYSERMIECIIMVFKNARNCAYRTINMGFPGGSVVENPPAKAGGLGLTPELGRYPGEGNGNLLQYSCLENPMGRGGQRATVHGVAKEADITE